MAISSGPRLGLTRWSQGTDAVARSQFDGDFADLDAKAFIFLQGTLAARPAAGIPGRQYTVVGDGTAENNGKMFYDTGSTWIVSSSYSTNLLTEAASAGGVPLVARGVASQSADIIQAKNSGGTNLFRVAPDGLVTNQATAGTSPGAYFGSASGHLAAGLFNSVAVNKQAVLVRGMASQTEAILAVQDSSSANLFRVMPSGNAVVSGDISAATASIAGTLTVGSISTGSGTVALKNVVATPNATNDTPLTARGITSQTGNLFAVQNNSSQNLLRVAPDGSLSTSGKVKVGNSAGADSGNYITTDPTLMAYGQGLSANTPVLRVTGGSGSTGNLVEVQNSAGDIKYWINNAGSSGQTGNTSAASAFFGSTSGTPTQINNTTYTPRLEILTGTEPAAFDDLVVLRHTATNTSAFERRVGISFKLGDESTLANSQLSAAVGVRSIYASSATPNMYFNVAGTDAATLESDGTLSILNRLQVTPGVTGEKLRLYATESYGLGVQSSSLYFRTGGAYSWYRNGTFVSTAKDPGSGGTLLMDLDSGGRLTTTRLNVTAGSTGTGDTGIAIGSLSGSHGHIGPNTLDHFTSSAHTAGSPFYIQYFSGGDLVLGDSGTKVRLDSRTLWTGGNRVYWGNSTWTAQGGGPIANDWWFDYTNNQIKVRNDFNEWKIVADDATFS